MVFSSLREIAEQPIVHVKDRSFRADERSAIGERIRSHAQMFREFGNFDLAQMRILICDGARLLGWFGALDTGPFRPWQRELLRTIARGLGPRLRFERERQNSGLAEAALEASLEALGAPAVLLNRRGAIAHANEAAQELLDERCGALRELLAQIRRTGSAAGADVFDLAARGHSGARLVILRSTGTPAAERQRIAVKAWRLTPREAQVLELIVAGDTNRDIATTLGLR